MTARNVTDSDTSKNDDNSTSSNAPAAPPSQSALYYDVLASASAGIISRILTHPLDTAKARLQATSVSNAQINNPTSFRGPLDVMLKTYRREGIRALYGGFGAVIVGGTPGTVLYLSGYAFFKDSISSFLTRSKKHTDATNISTQLSHGQEFLVHFSSGLLAEAVTCVIYVPVDVVKERLQVQQRFNSEVSNAHYKGSWDALRSIIRHEGLSGIYKGYGATLASFGSFSALYFVFYERCKGLARNHAQSSIDSSGNSNGSLDDGDLPFLHLVACSAGAGALASWITSPVDMAKLRLQVQRGGMMGTSSTGAPEVRYNGMLDCLRVIYNEGGVRGLFRGAGARVLHFAPATAITMACYEKFRTFYASFDSSSEI